MLFLARRHVEDRRVGVLEERCVQQADGLIGVVFFNHEAHVDFAGALRNHADVENAQIKLSSLQPLERLFDSEQSAPRRSYCCAPNAQSPG